MCSLFGTIGPANIVTTTVSGISEKWLAFWYTQPQVYKTFLILNSSEHEFYPANKSQIIITANSFLLNSSHRGYNTFVVLNSAEHEILSANKYENAP